MSIRHPGQSARHTVERETYGKCVRRTGETNVDGTGDSYSHGGERDRRADRGMEQHRKSGVHTEYPRRTRTPR